MKTKKKSKGFSLVEALVGMAIIGFVIVTILGAFSHQKIITRKNAEKNVAVRVADQKMQELLQFSSEQLENYAVSQSTPGLVVDYIVPKDGDLKYLEQGNEDPYQMRRLVYIETDLLGEIATINVMVEYGRTRTKVSTDSYPFRVTLSTRRGLDPRR